MIVKVQLPLAGAMTHALVYNKDRSYNKMLLITPALEEKMGGEKLAYFSSHSENGELILGRKRPVQVW